MDLRSGVEIGAVCGIIVCGALIGRKCGGVDVELVGLLVMVVG